MRTIAQISDLHFGRVDDSLIEPLIAALEEVSPHVLAVSGDLTQRARSRQFAAAARFLDRLHFPKIIVPGNHDIPLFNVVARFARPLHGYCKHVTADLSPFYADDEVAVLGINTARSLTWKAGRINHEQLATARKRLCEVPESVVKVVVTHHPFDVAPGTGEHEIVGRAAMAITELARCGVDVLLAGHLHKARSTTTAERYSIAGHAALVVQAGTALSERTRDEMNSFNVLRIETQRVEVQPYLWDPPQGRFVAQRAETFHGRGSLWRHESAAA